MQRIFRLVEGKLVMDGLFPSNSPWMIVKSESTTDSPPLDELVIIIISNIALAVETRWTTDPFQTQTNPTNSVCVAGVVGVVADFPVKQQSRRVRCD